MFDERLDDEAALIAFHFNRKDDVAFGWEVINAIADTLPSHVADGSLLDDINSLRETDVLNLTSKRKVQNMEQEIQWYVLLLMNRVCSLDTVNRDYTLDEALTLFNGDGYCEFLQDISRIHEIANELAIKMRPSFANGVRASEWLIRNLLWALCETLDVPQWKTMKIIIQTNKHELNAKYTAEMDRTNAEHIYGLFRLIEWYFQKQDVKLDMIAVLNRVNGTYYDNIEILISDYIRTSKDKKLDDGTASELLGILEYYGIDDDYKVLLKGVPVEDLMI